MSIGWNFQPGATRGDIPANGKPNGTGGGALPQGPAKLLTYRLTKSPLGQSAIAPRSLLESPGAGGATNQLIRQLMRGMAPPMSQPGVVGPPPQMPSASAPPVSGPSSPAPSVVGPQPVMGIPPQPGRPRPVLQPLPGLPDFAPSPKEDVTPEPLFEVPRQPGGPPISAAPFPSLPSVPAPPQLEVPLEPSPGTPPHIGFSPDPPPPPPPPSPQQPEPEPPAAPEPERPSIPEYKQETLPPAFELAPLPTGNDTQSLFDDGGMDWHALKRLFAGGDY